MYVSRHLKNPRILNNPRCLSIVHNVRKVPICPQQYDLAIHTVQASSMLTVRQFCSNEHTNEHANQHTTTNIEDIQQNNDAHHIPVMSNEVQQYLISDNIRKADARGETTYLVDATCGHGGHTLQILQTLKHAKLLCIDRDPQMIKTTQTRVAQAGFHDRVTFYNGSFAQLHNILQDPSIGFPPAVDGIFYDLGVNSAHIDTAQRGFSYRHDGPLDMRFDPSNQNERSYSASELLNKLNFQQISLLFRERGGETKYADAVAKAIVAWRGKGSLKRNIRSTWELRFIIDNALLAQQAKREARVSAKRRQRQTVLHTRQQQALKALHKGKALYWKTAKERRKDLKRLATLKPVDPLVTQRIFQALRLAVNQEETHIIHALRFTPAIVAPGGRVVILSFSPHEDSFVERLIEILDPQNDSDTPHMNKWTNLTHRIPQDETVIGSSTVSVADYVRPLHSEARINSRARSAHLRAFQRDVGTNEMFGQRDSKLEEITLPEFGFDINESYLIGAPSNNNVHTMENTMDESDYVLGLDTVENTMDESENVSQLPQNTEQSFSEFDIQGQSNIHKNDEMQNSNQSLELTTDEPSVSIFQQGLVDGSIRVVFEHDDMIPSQMNESRTLFPSNHQRMDSTIDEQTRKQTKKQTWNSTIILKDQPQTYQTRKNHSHTSSLQEHIKRSFSTKSSVLYQSPLMLFNNSPKRKFSSKSDTLNTDRHKSTRKRLTHEKSEDQIKSPDSMFEQVFMSAVAQQHDDEPDADEHDIQRFEEALANADALNMKHSQMLGQMPAQLDETSINQLANEFDIDVDNPDMDALERAMTAAGIPEKERDMLWNHLEHQVETTLRQRLKTKYNMSDEKVDSIIDSDLFEFQSRQELSEFMQSVEHDTDTESDPSTVNTDDLSDDDLLALIHANQQNTVAHKVLDTGKTNQHTSVKDTLDVNVDTAQPELKHTSKNENDDVHSELDDSTLPIKLPKAFTEAGITLDNFQDISPEELEAKVLAHITPDTLEELGIGGLTWEQANAMEEQGQSITPDFEELASRMKTDNTRVLWAWDAERDPEYHKLRSTRNQGKKTPSQDSQQSNDKTNGCT